MQLTQHTIVITGGSSGIGLQLSEALIQRGNTVIICGRSKEKLSGAQRQLPSLTTYPCDLSDPAETTAFAQWLQTHYPKLNVLINNAAVAHSIDFLQTPNALSLAQQEYQTNLFAPMRLIQLLHPQLSRQHQAAILNISTGLVYAPSLKYPFYNGSKAALHAFTQTLRVHLQDTPIRVLEVFFPVVDTPWHSTPPPNMAISAQEAVKGMLRGWERGDEEIRVGQVKLLYWLARIAPKFAFRKINALK